MSKHSDVFDLAIIKTKNEKKKIELILKDKQREKERLQQILDQESQAKYQFDEQIKQTGKITNDMIFNLRRFDGKEREDIFRQIQTINSDISKFKSKYLSVKNKITKIEGKKQEKLDQEQKKEENKQERQVLEESILKSRLERRDDN